MKKSGTHAFVNQFLVCLLVTMSFGGSIGLGTVWMRHQISVAANTNRALTDKIAEFERLIRANVALVETEQSARVLQQRNAAWSLGMAEATDTQMIRVAADPVRLLVARSIRDVGLESTGTASYRIALGQ